MEILRNNLRLGRLSKGLSQRQVGELARMSSHKIFRTEKDPSNLRVDDLMELCKVLNLDISEVFTKDIFNVGVRNESYCITYNGK
jgi:transcriptional regulator with XRE-family HTH domain